MAIPQLAHASYVDGPLKKSGDDAFIFPVGRNGYLRTLAITAGGNTSDAFTAEYLLLNPQALYVNNLSPGIDHISQCKYWFLAQDDVT